MYKRRISPDVVLDKRFGPLCPTQHFISITWFPKLDYSWFYFVLEFVLFKLTILYAWMYIYRIGVRVRPKRLSLVLVIFYQKKGKTNFEYRFHRSCVHSCVIVQMTKQGIMWTFERSTLKWYHIGLYWCTPSKWIASFVWIPYTLTTWTLFYAIQN